MVGLAFIAFLVLQSPPPTVPGVVAVPSQSASIALAHDRSLGDPAAPLTLDVWADFQCPYCQLFWTAAEPTLVKTFVETGKVRIVNHDFVFIGPESLDAAVAARCADQQGLFWPYHDLLYANQGRENSGAFSASRLTQFASVVGLDTGKWKACLSDTAITDAIHEETTAGQALGVRGTPTLFLNGIQLAAFDVTTVTAAINKALGVSAPASSSPAGSPAPSSSISASPGATP